MFLTFLRKTKLFSPLIWGTDEQSFLRLTSRAFLGYSFTGADAAAFQNTLGSNLWAFYLGLYYLLSFYFHFIWKEREDRESEQATECTLLLPNLLVPSPNTYNGC